MAPLSELMRAAGDGDQAAWNAIVDRFSGLVWSVARAHRLSGAEAADVTQTTWLRLVENLDRISDPDRLGGWLATVARRECLRHLRLRGREVMVEDDTFFEAPAGESAESALIARERDDALRRAFAGSRSGARRSCGCWRRRTRQAMRRSAPRSGCRSARSVRPGPAAWRV